MRQPLSGQHHGRPAHPEVERPDRHPGDELRQRYDSLREVYLLRSSIPICAWCKSIRDDAGIWKRLETYLEEQADIMPTHGVCPSCMTQREADDAHAPASST
ncbi:MAG: hypothetical protein EA417_22645 [Gammaproteobacteria bacterium]|nr:MAG: hypothetical protein EA417_22645 [Gammaproteobacteria bacterium]